MSASSLAASEERGIATATLETCETARKVDTKLSADLLELGWMPLVVGDTTLFSGRFTDAIMATSTGGPSDKKNWPNVFNEASKATTELIHEAFTEKKIFLFTHMDDELSVLAALPRDDIAPDAVHCIFAGSISTGNRVYMEDLANLDAMGGIVQANPAVNIFHNYSVGPRGEGEAGRQISDTVFGHYTGNPGAMKPHHHSGSELAFSLIRHEEK